jgi:hypothetical protein
MINIYKQFIRSIQTFFSKIDPNDDHLMVCDAYQSILFNFDPIYTDVQINRIQYEQLRFSIDLCHPVSFDGRIAQLQTHSLPPINPIPIADQQYSTPIQSYYQSRRLSEDFENYKAGHSNQKTPIGKSLPLPPLSASAVNIDEEQQTEDGVLLPPNERNVLYPIRLITILSSSNIQIYNTCTSVNHLHQTILHLGLIQRLDAT